MYCKNCNKEILETTKFCPNCGSKIEQVEEVVEVSEESNQDQTDKVIELSISNILNKQTGNKSNKRAVIFVVVMTVIISISSISLYKVFISKGKDSRETILTNTTDTDKLGVPEEEIEYHEYPVTVQEAISIAEKVITSGRVEVVSDRIRKNDNFYYEILNYTNVEYRDHSELGTLYIDKKTGDVWMPDTYNPANPWTKVEGVIGGSADEQQTDSADSPSTQDSITINKPTTSGEQYVRLNGIWTDDTEIRRYVREGYYVEINDFNMFSGDYLPIFEQSEIADILKQYRGSVVPNVFTIQKNPTSSTQEYDQNRFEDIFSDSDIENSIIVSVMDNNNKEEYKELLIFEPENPRKCRVYMFSTGPNVLLTERGDFYKIADQVDLKPENN